MYLNILKKDLKRKKTMNTILLLFIVLASMFVSSSVNNIIAVSTALDSFFEKAGMPNYFIGTLLVSGEESLDEYLDSVDCITSYKSEPYLRAEERIVFDGEKIDVDSPVFTNLNDMGIKCFDENNDEITEVNRGEVYVPYKFLESTPLSAGDTFTIKCNDKSLELKIMGISKDAFLSSRMMGMTRFIINSNDYKYISSNYKEISGHIAYVNTNNADKLNQLLGKNNFNIIFNADVSVVKTAYIIDMVVAIILLVVSVCLVLISFAVLRFSINFTLEEEFREIGVMKSIGIGNTKIRGLYLVKYLAISVIGALIGFFAGLPFGKMMLDSVSKSIVMTTENGVIINLVFSLLVVVIVMMFCFRCTRKIKKFTPIDAIRNGTTGERYNSKSKLSLSKSRSKPVFFMAINDILSSFKRYAVMIFTFTIGFLLILAIANTASTMKSGSMVELLAVKKTDVYMYSSDFKEFYAEDGRDKLLDRFSNIEKTLSENDMSGECCADVMFMFQIKKGDRITNSIGDMGVNTKTTDYKYLEGTAPQNTDEVAITAIIAEKINASIGDTVTVSNILGSKDYIVTAIFQTMNNLGEGIRFHEDSELNFIELSTINAIQITFDDSPSISEINKRVEKIAELYPDYKVYNTGDFVDYLIGGYNETINSIKYLMLMIVLVVSILVVVLMERSFITKEKSEIALLKATGFRDSAIVGWHTLRIFVIMLISVIIGELISTPISEATMGQIFKSLGAQSISFVVNPIENYLIYPILMLAVTLIATSLTALYTRTINASEISNIE